MILLCLRSIVGAALLFGLAASAAAENRMALVIGNSIYRSIPTLAAPANDAKLLAGLLQSAGFQILWGSDVGQNDMRRAVRDFAADVAAMGPDTIALVFYSGYGIQIDGENFLIPVDAMIERKPDVAIEALRLSDLINSLAAVPSKARIVIIDAAQGNPYARFRDSSGRGLAMADAPAGSIIAYSAAPGTEAPDAARTGSPFVAALIAVAKIPGLPVDELLRLVRVAVHEATDGRQTPWENSSLTAGVAFVPSAAATVTPPKPKQNTADLTKEVGSLSEADAFELVLGEDSVEAYQAFLAVHASSPFGARARALLDRRRQMIAFHDAERSGSAAAMEAYLRRFPDSDLTVTARGLLERARTHSTSAAPANAGDPPRSAAVTPTSPDRTPDTANEKVRTKPGRKMIARPPAGSPSSRNAAAPARVANPLCESYFRSGGRECCTYDAGGAPRIICR